ncbi:hypothetical protein [Nocardia transvalensis]|uniref:hypothetical protein n=1 Tax=Nocardia transvalensis TaxID=37333 RepID=UPI003A5CBBA1
MVMALEELGLLACFDAVYGSSAGALNGAWLLCGRANHCPEPTTPPFSKSAHPQAPPPSAA